LTPEEDAKVTLGLASLEGGMSASLLEAKADGVMRAGLSQLLDIVPPLPLNGQEAKFVVYYCYNSLFYLFISFSQLCCECGANWSC
jgi:hypothetical protein